MLPVSPCLTPFCLAFEIPYGVLLFSYDFGGVVVLRLNSSGIAVNCGDMHRGRGRHIRHVAKDC